MDLAEPSSPGLGSEVRGGRLTGAYWGSDCCGEEKKRRILESFESVHAYGDTQEDAAMRDLADAPYLRGKPMRSQQADVARA